MKMTKNIADYVLEQYYQNIYPKPLGSNRIRVPGIYKQHYGNYKTYQSLAKAIVGNGNSDELIAKLKKEAYATHEPPKKEEEILFPKDNNLVLSAYALKHFGATHALDQGKPLRQKLDQFLQKTYASNDLTNLGIIPNTISSTVWSYHVTQNVGYTGVSLQDIETIPLRNNPVVWIFENDNTAQRIFSENLSFPFIIASGRPTRAFHALIKRLIEQETTIYYHGDMDLAGIDMFDNLKNQYPEITAPFMNIVTFENSKPVPIPKEQPYNVENSHLAVLANTIKRTNTVVYEEQLDLKKCLQIM